MSTPHIFTDSTACPICGNCAYYSPIITDDGTHLCAVRGGYSVRATRPACEKFRNRHQPTPTCADCRFCHPCEDAPPEYATAAFCDHPIATNATRWPVPIETTMTACTDFQPKNK